MPDDPSEAAAAAAAYTEGDHATAHSLLQGILSSRDQGASPLRPALPLSLRNKCLTAPCARAQTQKCCTMWPSPTTRWAAAKSHASCSQCWSAFGRE